MLFLSILYKISSFNDPVLYKVSSISRVSSFEARAMIMNRIHTLQMKEVAMTCCEPLPQYHLTAGIYLTSYNSSKEFFLLIPRT